MQNYSLTNEFHKILKGSKQALIALDGNIDLDAFGSGIGLSYLLEQLGIEHALVCSNPIPKQYEVTGTEEKLLISSSISEIYERLPKVDLIIIPDLGNLEQLGELYRENQEFFSVLPIVHIDHHKHSIINSVLGILDPSASSTCEQLYLIFQDLSINIPGHVATALYSGILSDTRSFTTPTVTPRTLSIAADLVNLGANIVAASRQVVSQPATQLRLWGLALTNLETAIEDKVFIATVSEDMIHKSGSSWAETSGLVNLVDNIIGSEVAVLFKKFENGSVRVNFRSPGKHEVVKVAQKFGGGGHTYAAACTIKDVSLEEAKEKVLNELKLLLHNESASIGY